MKHLLRNALLATLVLSTCTTSPQTPAFRVLALYSEHVEPDHVQFAEQAVPFLTTLAAKDHFFFKATTHYEEMNAETLNQYQLVIWLNEPPVDPAQRAAFAAYMQGGGGWLGFHVTGYNDSSTNWPWFVHLLGGAVFESNNWPPLPATLAVEDRLHPVTRGLPSTFVSPANEWYVWKPDPRESNTVKVLLSLQRANYPLGWKDTLVAGDLPVVWTNTAYRMLYMNMGHGDKIFTSAVQNRLIENAILWLGTTKQIAPSSSTAEP